MSKIVKKKDLDVLIESTLNKAGIETPKKEKKVVTESKAKEVVTETKKEVITESNKDLKNELAKFNKLTKFNYKY